MATQEANTASIFLARYCAVIHLCTVSNSGKSSGHISPS